MRTIYQPGWMMVALACVLLMAKGQRDRYTVSFHLEATSAESPKLVFQHEVGQPPQQRYFRRAPEVTHKNISAYHSFPAADGNGFGLVLQMDAEGTRKLEMATSTAQGSLIRVMVNGTGVDVLFIDRPIRDGRLTIWSGIPPEVLKHMERKLPRLEAREETQEEAQEEAQDPTGGDPVPSGSGEWPTHTHEEAAAGTDLPPLQRPSELGSPF